MGNLGGWANSIGPWAFSTRLPLPVFHRPRLTPPSAAAAPLTMAGQVAGREDEEGGLVGKLRR